MCNSWVSASHCPFCTPDLAHIRVALVSLCHTWQWDSPSLTMA
jgi:hypothetical protein